MTSTLDPVNKVQSAHSILQIKCRMPADFRAVIHTCYDANSIIAEATVGRMAHHDNEDVLTAPDLFDVN